MRGDRLTKKWKLIKLSKMQRSDFAVRFIEEVFEDGEILLEFARKYGEEKGREVRKNIRLESFKDVAEFFGMISGVRFESGEREVVYTGCPAHQMTEVKKQEVCIGFITGFFQAFDINVAVSLRCGEVCRVVVELQTELWKEKSQAEKL